MVGGKVQDLRVRNYNGRAVVVLDKAILELQQIGIGKGFVRVVYPDNRKGEEQVLTP